MPYNSEIFHFCFDISLSTFVFVLEISMAFKMCVACFLKLVHTVLIIITNVVT